MKKEISKILVSIAFGFLLCFSIIGEKTRVETKILKGVEVLKTDTVYVPKPYPIIKEKIVYVKTPYKTVKLDTVYLVSSKNYYRDTLEVEKGFKLTYFASTIGTLDSLTLGYIDSRPDRLIKETVIKQPRGLYIGATSNLNLDTSVGLLLLKNKNIIGASVKLNQDNFSSPTKYNVSYYRRLF
jgi:hypothetical protein